VTVATEVDATGAEITNEFVVGTEVMRYCPKSTSPPTAVDTSTLKVCPERKPCFVRLTVTELVLPSVVKEGTTPPVVPEVAGTATEMVYELPVGVDRTG
jgi:hypothetical protein